MTHSVADVVLALDRIAPFDNAADWDPVGLQIGDRERSVTSVAVCHEITQLILDRLLVAPPSLVVTYHPLIFRPLRSLTAVSGPEGRALRLAEAGVAVVAVHTNFDVARDGTTDALAGAVGVVGAAPFGAEPGGDRIKLVAFVPEEHAERLIDALAAAGAGAIGDYRGCAFVGTGEGRFTPVEGANPTIGEVGEPTRVAERRVEMIAPRSRERALVAALRATHPYEEPAYDISDVRAAPVAVGRVGPIAERSLGEFAEVVEAALDAPARVAGERARPVRTVAVVPGSGADFIAAAAAAGADVLVTGDVSHHRARAAAEQGLAIIDPGHGPTERPGVKALYASVRSIVGDAIDLTGVDDSPWEAN